MAAKKTAATKTTPVQTKASVKEETVKVEKKTAAEKAAPAVKRKIRFYPHRLPPGGGASFPQRPGGGGCPDDHAAVRILRPGGGGTGDQHFSAGKTAYESRSHFRGHSAHHVRRAHPPLFGSGRGSAKSFQR